MLGLSALQVWNLLLGNIKTDPEATLGELRGASQFVAQQGYTLIRQYVYMIGMVLSASSILFDPPPFWDEMLCLLTFVVLMAAWVWGVCRLYLVVWASVGLSRKMV